MIRLRHISLYLVMAICMSGLFSLTAIAQTPEQTPQPAESNPVVGAIEQSSHGSIDIEIPEDLMHLILNGTSQTATTHRTTPARVSKPSTGKMNGYRIQVFSDGRNPSTLGARARARGNAVAARFPKYRGQIYTFSSNPNWYCRVGNFRTAAEANAALSELKRAFPAFAAEMRTVACSVIIK